jgi:hypothetical protein
MSEVASTVQLGFPDQLLFEMPDGSGTYVEVPQLMDIPGSSGPADEVDVSNRQSPNREKENIPGFSSPAEESYESNGIFSTVQEAIRAAKGTKRRFQKIYIDDNTDAVILRQSFLATIKDAFYTSPYQAQRKFQFTIKRSGAITEAAV